MGESLSTWTPSCNGAVRVELSGQRTTSDSGALLLREALDNSGVIEALEDNLVDRRHPLRIRHSLASQLRTLVLQRAMGWIDLSDTDTLRRDPLWQLACSDARGMTPQGKRMKAFRPRECQQDMSQPVPLSSVSAEFRL